MFQKQNRIIVFNKFKGHCAYCGESILIKNMQVDHIIPKGFFEMHINNNYKVPSFLKHLTINDVNHIDNLFPSCRVCNKWKDTFDLELFREQIKQQINRLNKYSANFRLAKKYGLVEETNINIVFYFETFKK